MTKNLLKIKVASNHFIYKGAENEIEEILRKFREQVDLIHLSIKAICMVKILK